MSLLLLSAKEVLLFISFFFICLAYNRVWKYLDSRQCWGKHLFIYAPELEGLGLFRICIHFSLMCIAIHILSFFQVAARLPRWAASWHCDAPQQRHPAAACVWPRQQGVSALPLPAHQDLLLCTRGIPYTPRRCPTSQLFCLRRFPGGSERRHGPGHSGSVWEISSFTRTASCCNNSVWLHKTLQAKVTLLGLTSPSMTGWSRPMQTWRRWRTATCSTSVFGLWGRSLSCTRSMAAVSALTSTTTSPTTWERDVKLM